MNHATTSNSDWEGAGTLLKSFFCESWAEDNVFDKGLKSREIGPTTSSPAKNAFLIAVIGFMNVIR